MIFIDAHIQTMLGGISSSFNPVPFPYYMEGRWTSSIAIAENVYSTDKGILDHVSDDDGASFTVKSFSDNMSIGAVGKTLFKPIPTFSGNNIIGRKDNNFVRIKRADSAWELIDLSTIPGSFASQLVSVVFDNVNSEFIVLKKSSTTSDILTTTDFISFVTFVFTDPIIENSVSDLVDVASIHYINGSYKAYGTQEFPDTDTAIRRVATSTDLTNWTLESTVQPNSTTTGIQYDSSICRFNGRLFLYFKDGNEVKIWSTSDGVIWVEGILTPLTDGAELGMYWMVTSAAVELLTSSRVLRSTDGITWTGESLKTNVLQHPDAFAVDGLNGIGMMIHGKGGLTNTETSSNHLSLSTGTSLQLGGKILELTGLNEAPTLGYPSTETEVALGWLQREWSRDQVIGKGFTLVGDNTSTRNTRSYYARNEATSRYYEIEVISSSSASNKIGARVLADRLITDLTLISTDIAYFNLELDLVSTPNGNDIVVTHTHTPGQIIGFLFDWVAKTCIISVDGITLATVTNINNTRTWTAYCDPTDGQFKLNVGQEAFSFNGTGATAWMTQ